MPLNTQTMGRRSCGVLILFTLLLQGCLGMTPAPKPVAPPLPEKLLAAPDLQTLAVTGSLLDLVQDETARALVREAVENNYDLGATALRLKSAGLLLARTRSARLPKVNAGYTGTRARGASDDRGRGRHRVSLSMSWELDLWGKLANEHQAAETGLQVKALDRDRALDSLAARVLQAYFRVKGEMLKIRAQEDRVAVFSGIEQTILDRYRSGLGDLKDLSSARSQTETARADVVTAREAHARALRDLELLLGRYPGKALTVGPQWPSVTAPPARLPADILAHRPDVRAARLKAVQAGFVAQARDKAMLPGITLTGNIFRDNAQFGDLGASSTAWDLAGGLLMPLFNGGRLKAEAQAADLEARAAGLDYAAVVLGAMKEAENTLAREAAVAAREVHVKKALDNARAASRHYETGYRQGISDIIALNTSREKEIALTLSLIDLNLARLVNRVDMALALGTGAGLEKEI